MESINLAHLHLLLNHLPIIGFGVGLCLYAVAYFGRHTSLKKHSLVLIFIVTVFAIPAYMTGNAAERQLCPDLMCPAGIDVGAIRVHEDLALLGFSLMELTGFFAWLTLWQLRKPRQPASWNWTAILMLAVVAFGAMSLAAAEGGEIRHAEIRADQAELPAAESLQEGSVARTIGAVAAGNTGIGWLWPAAEAVHFIGLCLIFGVVLVVDLRILGLGKGLSFSALYQLLPFAMMGFGLNMLTGMLFFLGSPGQYVNNVEFHRKVIFIVLAGFNVLYFMLADEAWTMGPNDDAPVRTKLVAASAIFIWVGILYYGHMLPFLGNSF